MHYAAPTHFQSVFETCPKHTLGKPIGGGRERVRAGGGIHILSPNDHQQITQIILHMYFGIPGLLPTSLEPQNRFSDVKNMPDAATLTLHAFT